VRVGDGGQWGNMQRHGTPEFALGSNAAAYSNAVRLVLRGGHRLASANTMGPTRVQNGTKDWPQTFESLALREAGTKE
jgi:hypothetical protein